MSMLLVAFETSCDETAVAFCRTGSTPTLVAEVVSSQVEVHEPYDGVVPELASRAHLSALPLVLENACVRAQCSLDDVGAVAVTCGPGLKGCLLVGHAFAGGIAMSRNLPFLGVHHIEGHLLIPMYDNPELTFPFLALVVSGGHTEIVYVEGVGRYTVLSRTMDDAAGEAFDKAASLLGFSYPGGPQLAALADSCTHTRFSLPLVMQKRPEMSFAGLKTAISRLVKTNAADDGSIEPEIRTELALCIQDSIVDALLFKLKKSLACVATNRVVVTGGVAANKALRQRVCELPGVHAFFPGKGHSTDNAGMIAYVAALRVMQGERTALYEGVRPRWTLESLCEESSNVT